MKLRGALVGFVFITAVYIGALIWIDLERQLFTGAQGLWPAIVFVALMSCISFIIRYLRWHWLLSAGKYQVPVGKGFLSYMAGFAFTATPGKVGELLRIRYFSRLGVPSDATLSAFIYERAMDLIIVLLLASIGIRNADVYFVATGFVIGVMALICIFIFEPNLINRASIYLRALGALRLSRLARTLNGGLSGCQIWVNTKALTISATLGLAAWGLTALSFVFLCQHLGMALNVREGVSIYPISMLAGAASMLPGGLGSTEAIIVAILAMEGFELTVATLAAVGIRLATLWLSIFCGLVSVGVLEFKTNPGERL